MADRDLEAIGGGDGSLDGPATRIDGGESDPARRVTGGETEIGPVVVAEPQSEWPTHVGEIADPSARTGESNLVAGPRLDGEMP